MNAKETIGGRYEIRRSLGRGGMAAVFLAWDLTLQREVAIKALRPDLLADPYEVSRFLIEGQTMARIESDHVVAIFDVHSSAKGTYIVMERVIGETIEEIVRRKGQVPLFDALQAARDVLLALADLHDAGLIHRDIKPANVLVGTDGKTKLLDLGVAFDQRSPGFTLPHHTCGTPGYMSPEQRATGHVDARSDLYQLGLLLVYALTGSEAVAGRATTEVLSRVPAEISPLVHRVLSEDPSARYQSAGEMLAEIQIFCNGARTVEIGVVDPREIAAYEAKVARASVKQPRIPVISTASISLAMPPQRSGGLKLAAIGAALGLAVVGV
ncbi:MAG TPA: serine/threonine-protein kinase, partial [Kofleriaceae bacterium]